METSPPSPSANISAQPSYQQDYSVNYQKLQPKFKDCTFDSDKKPEYLRTWLRLLSGIVRNIPHGKQIENFLDSYLQRRLNEATTRPSFLQEAGLQLSAPSAEAPSSAEDTNDQGSEAEVTINDPSEYPKAYYQLSPESQALDKALFHTLFTIVQGSYLDLITDLTGENARYTFAIHCVIRWPVIRREAALIAHAWSMQSIIKVSWIMGFIKIGHQIRDPRWRKPLGTYPGPRWMSPPP